MHHSPILHAPAAGTELQLHEPTVQRMREHYSKRGVELNEARLRMATLPAGAEVAPLSLVLCIRIAGVAPELTLCTFVGQYGGRKLIDCMPQDHRTGTGS